MWFLAVFALLMSNRDARDQSPAPPPVAAAAREFDGEIGVYARNLISGEEIAVNADVRFPTASTIKTAVMVEAHHQAAEGKLTLDERLTLTDAVKVGGSGVLNGLGAGLQLTIRDLIHLMITVSDNTATNMLVARLGTKQIDDRLVAHGLHQTKIFPADVPGRPRRRFSRARARIRPGHDDAARDGKVDGAHRRRTSGEL